MIVDRQGRRFRNLRISLTSACNYACTYCVPNGKRLVAAVKAAARERGVGAVELDVHDFNEDAQAFFLAQGFTAVKHRLAATT